MLTTTSAALFCVFLYTYSPLLMASVLIISAVTGSVILTFVSFNSWFSFMLVLIFISGMMVIFVYVSSVTANETNKLVAPVLLYMLVTGLVISASMKFNWVMNNSLTLNKSEPLTLPLDPELFTYKVLSFMFGPAAVGLMLYLLLALVASVKISTFLKHPMRATN